MFVRFVRFVRLDAQTLRCGHPPSVSQKNQPFFQSSSLTLRKYIVRGDQLWSNIVRHDEHVTGDAASQFQARTENFLQQLLGSALEGSGKHLG